MSYDPAEFAPDEEGYEAWCDARDANRWRQLEGLLERRCLTTRERIVIDERYNEWGIRLGADLTHFADTPLAALEALLDRLFPEGT